MAFTSGLVLHAMNGGSEATTGSGGGFDTGVSGMATDGAATAANTNAPVFTSASYNFVAGDVGHWLFIKAGTNWIPGWYQIASVAAGAATLTAGIGVATLVNFGLNTVVGAATTASPTGATWSVDYSRVASFVVSYADLVIDATTNTNATSATFPFTINRVGNLITVSSGTGFTVQRLALVSVAGVIGTFDKSLGTLSSTAGVAKLGGSLTGIGVAGSLLVAGATHFVKYNATVFTLTSATTNSINGRMSISVASLASPVRVRGYDVTPGDETANRPTLKWGLAAGGTAIFTPSTSCYISNFILDGNRANFVNQQGISQTNTSEILLRRIKFTGFDGVGLKTTASTSHILTVECEFTNCTANSTVSIQSTGVMVFLGCNFHDNLIEAISSINGAPNRLIVDRCLFYNNKSGVAKSHIILGSGGSVLYHAVIMNSSFYNSGTHAIDLQSLGAVTLINNVIETSGGWGINLALTGPYYLVTLINNIFYNHTSGNFDTTKLLPMNLYGNIANTLGSAFQDPANGKFNINRLAGRGANAASAAYPRAWVGNTPTANYMDIGGVQHAMESSFGGAF